MGPRANLSWPAGIIRTGEPRVKSLVRRAGITVSGRWRGGIKSVAAVRIGIFFLRLPFLGKGVRKSGEGDWRRISEALWTRSRIIGERLSLLSLRFRLVFSVFGVIHLRSFFLLRSINS